jgi:hypothetical protein
VLVIYGPCNTCIAWFVTEPEEFATGFAVADTPPMSLANVGVVDPSKQIEISLRKCWLYLLRFG